MAGNKFPKQLELFGLPKEVQLSYVLRKEVILEKLIDLDIRDEETYNNQGFYLCSEQRLRFLLITTETFYWSHDEKEDNKYYDCINLATLEVNNFDLAKELLFMDSVDLYHYVEIEKGYDWVGEDYEHITEYIDFVEYRQDKYRWLNQGENWDSDKMNIERVTLKELLARYRPLEHRYTMSDVAMDRIEKELEAKNRGYYAIDDSHWDRYV
jgi:hypothetical protein